MVSLLLNKNGKIITNENGKPYKTNNVSEKTIQAIETTYADLVELRDINKLVPGQTYIITDYECTTIQEDTQSAGHQFDVIVVADSSNTLNEIARARLHKGDTYFAETDLGAWELKYTIDNDNTRFAWADEESGKGVIYYMKDEFGNECPYDFKNIKFKGSSLFRDPGNSLIDDNAYYYTFSATDGTEDMALLESNNIHDNILNSYGSISTSNGYIKKLNHIVFLGKYFYNNTFGNECHHITFRTNSYCNNFGVECYNNYLDARNTHNIFKNRCSKNVLNYACSSNVLNEGCTSNTFKGNNTDNILGSRCVLNTFYDSSSNNTFGCDCTVNEIGCYCNNNILGSANKNNIIGNISPYGAEGSCNNIFGDLCEHNSISDACYNNIFGNECKQNNLSEKCNNNEFGVGSTSNKIGITSVDEGVTILGSNNNVLGKFCVGNIIGENSNNNNLYTNCINNIFGDDCNNNTLDLNCEGNTFSDGCEYNMLAYECETNTFPADCKNNYLNIKCKRNKLNYGLSNLTLNYSQDVDFAKLIEKFDEVINLSQYLADQTPIQIDIRKKIGDSNDAIVAALELFDSHESTLSKVTKFTSWIIDKITS